MSMITALDRKRLNEIIAIVKPANSLAARLANLADEQRANYDEWNAYCEQWWAHELSKANADQRESLMYEYHLQGREGPPLRSDIDVALNGPRPTIPLIIETIDPRSKRATARPTSDDSAAEIYRRYCDDQR